jgi:hypothetical protein
MELIELKLNIEWQLLEFLFIAYNCAIGLFKRSINVIFCYPEEFIDTRIDISAKLTPKILFDK